MLLAGLEAGFAQWETRLRSRTGDGTADLQLDSIDRLPLAARGRADGCETPPVGEEAYVDTLFAGTYYRPAA
jgi:hypothetical protein